MLMTSLYVAPVILQSGVQIVRAAESDAEALIGRIENLPPVEDLNETHAEEVKSLMTAYSQLKMSDRIAVTNYELLKKDFDALVKKGILTNEDNTILQEQELQKKKQASKNLSDTAVSQEKQYTFKSDGKKGTTIIIRYTTDADGDGKGDAPTIKPRKNTRATNLLPFFFGFFSSVFVVFLSSSEITSEAVPVKAFDEKVTA